MSKEPTRREVEQVEPKPEEGWKHGYTPQQIKIIEDARGEPTPAPDKAEKGGRHDKEHQ